MRLFFCAVFFIFFIFICSCNKTVLTYALFDVTKPPNIYGNNAEMEAGSHRNVSVEYNAGSNDVIIPLSGHVIIDNAVQEEYAEINYNLINDVFGLQYSFAKKYDNDFYLGNGLGFQGFPYAFLSAGINKKSAEFGTAVLLGYASQKIDYSGYYKDDEGNKTSNFYETMYNGDIYKGAYFYTSFYFKRFALNYVASISNPMGDEIEEEGCSFICRTILSFDFPALLMQDIGIVYNNNRIKYRVGLNQITSFKFPGRYYSASFQVAWGW